MMDISTSIIHIQDEANEKKVFQCRGYGNCRMVFTRSEHLARHERKHTGEKPFNCILPGCYRKFSRFDNMMQHTQTYHSMPTSDKVPELVKSKPLKRKRTNNTKKTTKPTTTKKKTTTYDRKKKKTTNTVDVCKLSHDNHMTMLMDELFLLSDSSLLTSDEEDFDDDEIIDVDDSLLAAKKPATTDNTTTTTSIIGHMILPHLANYLVDHPNEPPENYFFQYYHHLSKQDLAYPLESLLLTASHHDNNEGEIYITIDEYEALQGLSRFYTTTCQK